LISFEATVWFVGVKYLNGRTEQVKYSKFYTLAYMKTAVIRQLFSTKSLNLLGTVFIAYIWWLSLTIIISSGITAHLALSFLWGPYRPAAIITLVSATAYFIWYRKFWPKNIFFFAFVWGASNAAFNVVYDMYHLSQLLVHLPTWQIGGDYLVILGMETLIGLAGYLAIRPTFNLDFSLIKYLGLGLFIAGAIYSFGTGFQVTSDPVHAAASSLYLVEFLETAGFMIFAYESTKIDQTMSIKPVFQISLLLLLWAYMLHIVQVAIPALDAFSMLYELIVMAPFIFSAFLLLERPVKLLSQFLGYLDRKRLFWNISVYRLFSLILPIPPLIILLMYFPVILSTGQNPLTAWYYSGHWIVWVALVTVSIRFGWNDAMKGIFAGAFIYASHETAWFFESAAQFSRFQYVGQTYQLSTFISIFKVLIFGYAPLTHMVVIAFLGYFLVWRVFSWKKELVIFSIPVVWGIIVLITNFPSTLYLGNPTPYYNDFWPNFADVLSWFIPIVVAAWPFSSLFKEAFHMVY
jgi:hypothetical protein